jgi:acetate kinase
MATRSGDLDPGVVLALLREGHDAASLETLLSRESGLLGLGGSGDVRELLAREAAGDEAAATALALFVRRIVLLVGAYFTLLEGRGALVFGGGIGTHSAELRARICAGLGSWNVRIDPARNVAGAPGRLSEDGARPVHVFETDEESLVARRTAAILAGEA